MPDHEKIINGLSDIAAYFRSSFDAMYGTVACEKFRDWTDAIEQALALLKAQEPRTETQGRWECVGSDGIVCCLVCGMPMNKTRVCFPNGESGYYYIATKYCPHCGAKNEKGDCDG